MEGGALMVVIFLKILKRIDVAAVRASHFLHYTLILPQNSTSPKTKLIL